MRDFMKKCSLFAVVVAITTVLFGAVSAEAAVKWAFSTANGKKKANVNATITMEKGEYQDMNLYRNGKQIKEKDASYKVSWYSSDKNVVYVDKASGKMKADKYGKMTKDSGTAKITAVIKNKKTGSTAKKSFNVKVETKKAEVDVNVIETPASAFEYTVEEGNVTITGLKDKTLTQVYIPEKIEGNQVTSIGMFAFSGCEKLTGMVLPNGITEIGFCAFQNCSALIDINLPSTIVTLGDSAFSGCSSLKNITLPVGIESIGRSMFTYCRSLTEIVIPGNVTSIGMYAFKNCTGLTKVVIPEGVQSIGGEAFYWCTSLEDIQLPSNNITIEWDAFYETPWLESQKESNDYLIINGTLYWVSDNVVGYWMVPDGTKSIGSFAFEGCTRLGMLMVPYTVERIEDAAFAEFSSLSYVEIPPTVTYIGEYVFQNSDSLTRISVIAGSYAEQWAIENGYEDLLVVY